MPIYKKLEGIRKLSNSSLTAIVDVTNINFKDLSAATLEFLKNIKYDETLNSANITTGNFEHVNISDKLSLKLDNIPTFTIDSLGRAEGQELLVKVSESKRHRFTDFNDWPDVGVPGEVIYTGVQNQKPQFGEDFIGYLDGRGWVSLTTLNSSISQLILDVLYGSPAIAPTVPLGSGSVWSGPLGLENVFVPSNNTLYYTDVNGDIFDILTDHVWSRSGNDATFIPTGKCIIGDNTNNGFLRYVDGNQSTGYVLTCDALGNATWQPPTGSGGGSGAGASYVAIVDFTANISETVTHNLGTTDVHVQLVDLDTNELIQAYVDAYTSNTVDITFTSDNQNVKVIIISTSAASNLEICGVPVQCSSPGPVDGDTLIYNSSLNVWETAQGGESYQTLDQTLNTAQITSFGSSPITVLPAPGANKSYIFEEITFLYDFTGDTYVAPTVSTRVELKIPGAGSRLIAYIVKDDMEASADFLQQYIEGNVDYNWRHVTEADINSSVQITTNTGTDFTTNSGATTGTLRMILKYRIKDHSAYWPIP